MVTVKPVLFGNDAAIDLVTDASVQLNLQDPDSMTLESLHNIVLDSQADHELIVVSNVGEPDQRVLRVAKAAKPVSQTLGRVSEDSVLAELRGVAPKLAGARKIVQVPVPGHFRHVNVGDQAGRLPQARKREKVKRRRKSLHDEPQ